MPETCTCGAQLPPDARFCHKCGKPQREEPRFDEVEEASEEAAVDSAPDAPLRAPSIEEVKAALAESAARVAAEPPEISLANVLAVRTALTAAGITFLVALLASPIPALAWLIWGAGGFFAVYLYRRRSGIRLTPSRGALLGWFCGLFLFVLALIEFTMLIVFVSPAEFQQNIRENAPANFPAEQLETTVNYLFTPAGMAILVGVLFFFVTIPPTLGGALGAKLLDRES